MFPNNKVARFSDYEILALDNNDYISKAVLAGTDWAAATCEITGIFTQNIDKPLVLDIGANLGTYAIKLGKSLQPKGGDVVAFEPQRVIFYHLCASVVLNRLDNVHPMNMALGDTGGIVDVPTSFDGVNCNYGAVSLDQKINEQRGWNFAPDSSEFSKVPISRLDDVYLPRKIDFIKMDVEGFEARVLDGALETLEASGWPPMILEVWNEQNFVAAKEELLNRIDSLGYQRLMLKNGECIAHHPNHSVQVNMVENPNGSITWNRVS
tara:strand:- start:724 stop:1521 length:798 start_codon:yes stop_codon:yes gene_type:complete